MLQSLCSFLGALFLTQSVRHYALQNLMDVPNHRSAHAHPTPRGGGISFVLMSLLFSTYLYLGGFYDSVQILSVGFGGLAIAILGFWDDHFALSAKIRLLCQFLIVYGVLWAFSPIPALEFFKGVSIPSFLMFILCGVGVVWILNLYNFMDGINGIAGFEALFFFLVGALFFNLEGAYAIADFMVCLAFAVLGFLCFNFPRASIFMGDVGSSFLGFVAGILVVWALSIDVYLFYALLILLAVFISDATVTLIMRIGRGESLTEAHKSHLYQRAFFRYGLYKVIALCTLLNLFFLFPLAFFVLRGYISPFLGLICAYLPISLMVFLIS